MIKITIMPRKKIRAPKVIADPIYGIFDIRPVLPMVDTEEFQALNEKRQLGMVYLTFPSATHSRRAHSLGAYHATRILADRWIELGLLSEEEGDALSGYALYHDIGHPAFSHVTEALCRKSNSELSLDFIEKLKSPIEASGINYELMLKMARHEHPASAGVFDKNIGMEKLDYLERDGFFTILSRPVGIDYLRAHIYLVGGKLAIDAKVIDNAIEVQNFYLKMYKNVYLRKAPIIAQRMLQKITHHLILEGKLTPDDLPKMTDAELLGLILFSRDSTVEMLAHLLKRRELFREAIVVKPRDFLHTVTRAGKAIATFGIPWEEMAGVASNPALHANNQESLGELEDTIAAIAGIPKGMVLVVPVFSPERFETQDISVYREDGTFDSLRELYPAHFKSMEEIGRSYFALRIATIESYRKTLSSPHVAQAVFELISGKRGLFES